MENITISVKTKKFEIEIPINSRITYLRGDSGQGKTAFTDLVRNSILNEDTNVDVKITDGYTPDVLDSTRLVSDIKARGKSIIIIDDNLGTEKPGFPKSIIDTLREIDSYLIVINRVDSLEDSLSAKWRDSIEYSVTSVLWVKKVNNSIKRIVKPLVYCLDTIESYDNVSDILE